LAEEVLVPYLEARQEAGQTGGSALSTAAEQALVRCAEAFRAVLPDAVRLGDGAVLAALALAANLQRTVEELTRRPDSQPVLSRRWCGLPPEEKRRRPGSGDASVRRPGAELRPLVRALGATPAEIQSRCDEALAALRDEIRRGGLFAPEDLPG
jgi:hypothetical protein